VVSVSDVVECAHHVGWTRQRPCSESPHSRGALQRTAEISVGTGNRSSAQAVCRLAWLSRRESQSLLRIFGVVASSEISRRQFSEARASPQPSRHSQAEAAHAACRSRAPSGVAAVNFLANACAPL